MTAYVSAESIKLFFGSLAAALSPPKIALAGLPFLAVRANRTPLNASSDWNLKVEPNASSSPTEAADEMDKSTASPPMPDSAPKEPEKNNSSVTQRNIDWAWLPIWHKDYKASRNTIVLCHGLWGFDKLGFDQFPRLQLQYWGDIHESLKKLGANVIVSKVPSTGTIAERARALHTFLEEKLDAGTKINFIAHSMGGLDCRYLLTHLLPTRYHPVSLTTLSTPHRGSPFMDFCRDYLGLGRVSKPDDIAAGLRPSTAHSHKNSSTIATAATSMSSSTVDANGNIKFPQEAKTNLSSTILTMTMLARTLDTPAYSNLTTSFLNDTFNPQTPDVKDTTYYSFGASMPLKDKETRPSVWNPLFVPHVVVSEKEGINDGLVSLKSARWGQYVGTLDCDHWDLRVACKSKEYETCEMYRGLSTFLFHEGF